MKSKDNLFSQNTISKTINSSNKKKERRTFNKNDFPKNFDLSLLLKKEKEREIEKANSTTQTGQKSLFFSNDGILNYNAHKTLYDTFYNSERNKNIFKKNNFFILNDKLYSRSKQNGKIHFQYENEKNKNNEININSINKRKSYKLNNLTIKDICYNSIINNYNKNNNYYKDNNIDMYHYYDLNQRRIEQIIPNINEYLNNNTNKKKMFKTNNKRVKSNNDITSNNNSNCNSNDTQGFLIQRSNFNNKPKKKYYMNKFNKTKKKLLNLFSLYTFRKNLKNENDDLCLFNSMNKDILLKKKQKLVITDKQLEKRVFSSRPNKKKRLWELEHLNLNVINKDCKIRVGAFNYTSASNSKKYLFN